MRRFAVRCALAAALLVPGATLASLSLTAAEQLCKAQGGTLLIALNHYAYTCPAAGLSETQLAIADRLCEIVYWGSFGHSEGVYTCEIS